MAIGERKSIEGRYWNSGHGVCVMASITEGIDWSAYIDADNGCSKKDCAIQTLETGTKLSEEDARHFFPNIELPYRM